MERIDLILDSPQREATDGPVPRSVASRFWCRAEAVTESGCLIWMGAQQGHPKGDGYGLVAVRIAKRKHYMVLAHRVAFALSRGYLPTPPLKVLHKCDVRLCIRPDHLYEGSQSENIRQAVARGRHVCGYGVHQTRVAAARRSKEGC